VQGYGEVRPTTINNAGDGTGVVTGITWDSWGDDQAVGHGTGIWVPPGAVAADGVEQPAQVVAFALGNCQGHPAYQFLTWYFPTHGETLNPDHRFDACRGFH
jgi:hypothetical protein